ncbi:MAG: hypothetical protein U5L02_09190 [Rheinheimera sp.]|nr:hypothetical protein [Rheinheimera sp.]
MKRDTMKHSYLALLVSSALAWPVLAAQNPEQPTGQDSSTVSKKAKTVAKKAKAADEQRRSDQSHRHP